MLRERAGPSGLMLFEGMVKRVVVPVPKHPQQYDPNVACPSSKFKKTDKI